MKIIENNKNIYKVLKEVTEITGKELKANSVDAAVEKHVPQYTKNEEEIEVYVNHVMEEDHYIEWITVEYENYEITKYFKPNEEPKLTVKYVSGAKLYAYCNKHGLWTNEVL